MLNFDKEVYKKIGYDDLVVFAVYSLTRANKEATFENVVAECFALFPERFALRGYPQWPDSAIVNKRWVSCRYRGLLLGSVKDGFRLTPSGNELAVKVDNQLGKQRPILKRVTKDLRTRESRFVNAIEASDAYRIYQSKSRGKDITDFDFCAMLMCTLDSEPSVLRRNLEQFIQYCRVMQRPELVDFLLYAGERFKHLLQPRFIPEKSFKGGMQKKKMS